MEPDTEARGGDSSNAEDVRWMLLAKQGDTAAFRQLVEKHHAAVYGVISKMLGGVSDSEDLAQQVFIRVWKSLPRYEPRAKFTTWLMTITRNLVFNEVRRRKRTPLVPMEENRPDEAPKQYEDPSPEGGPDAKLLEAELAAAVDAAIAGLPEIQRMAVVLRRYEELPYEEIAEILKLSIPALKSHLFRARATLRVQLEKYLEQ